MFFRLRKKARGRGAATFRPSGRPLKKLATDCLQRLFRILNRHSWPSPGPVGGHHGLQVIDCIDKKCCPLIPYKGKKALQAFFPLVTAAHSLQGKCCDTLDLDPDRVLFLCPLCHTVDSQGGAQMNKDIIVKVRMTQAQVEALDRAVAGSPADTRSAWVRWAIQQALQAAKTGKEH